MATYKKNFVIFTILLLGSSLIDAYELCGIVYDIIEPDDESTSVGTVPLKSVDVRAEVRGLTVGLIAELVYENTLNDTIQTRFVFPLSNEAAIYRLEAVIAGKRLIAKVEPVEKAREMYKQAVDAGKQAVLLESQEGTDDIFILFLGNLPAFETAVVTIGYIQPLNQMLADGILSFTLPMVLNPRYVPRHEITDSEVMKRKFALEDYIAVSEVFYSMTFSVIVSLGAVRSIKEIKARHPADILHVSFSQDNLGANVTLANEFKKDHDLELLITPTDATNPSSTVFVEPGLKGAGASWLAVDLVSAWIMPKRELLTEGIRPSNFEFWLVVDRSGSMSGKKIEDAKSALALLVAELPEGCFFNIVGFGMEYKVLFSNGVVTYNEKTRDEAISHLQSIRADLGGTEILDPLKFVYSKELRTDHRYILLVTDGQVSNTNEVVDLARQNAASTRVFAVGIGEGASTALVNGIARVSGGLSSFVRSKNDRLETKVRNMLGTMTAPRMSKANLTWTTTSGRLLETVPNEIQKFFLGKPIFQSAILQRAPESSLEGSLQFSQLGTDVDFSSPFLINAGYFSDPFDSLPLHRLSAKRMLTELIDEYYSSTKRSVDLKKRATEISIATGVLCEFTAFVAVDAESEEPINSKVQQEEFAADTLMHISAGEIGKGGQTRYSSSSASTLQQSLAMLLLLLVFLSFTSIMDRQY